MVSNLVKFVANEMLMPSISKYIKPSLPRKRMTFCYVLPIRLKSSSSSSSYSSSSLSLPAALSSSFYSSVASSSPFSSSTASPFTGKTEEGDKTSPKGEPSASASSSSSSSSSTSTTSSTSSSSSDSDSEGPAAAPSKPIASPSAVGLKTSTQRTDEVLMYLEEPKRVRFGLLKVILTMTLGIYFGAFLAKLGANLLEEYEIFVKGEDDDD